MSKTIECLKFLDTPKNQFQLAEKLNLSSIEVLNLIRKINKTDSNLIKNTEENQFYLNRKLKWLDKNLINLEIYKNNCEYKLEVLDEVDSTSSYIKNNLSILENQTVVTAEYQSEGRGRHERKWISKIAHDITVSILYFFPKNFNYEHLPLILAIAINRLLKDLNIVNKIKWPNDILLSDFSKIAGILVESGIYVNKRYIIIGIGINNIFDYERNKVLINLINYVDNILKVYQKFGFKVFYQEWLDNCIHFNKYVSVYQNNKFIDSGINTGISMEGHLLIDTKNGVKCFKSADISLRFSIDNKYNLLIDAGNSNIKFAIYEGDKLIKLYRVDTLNFDIKNIKEDIVNTPFENKLGSSVVSPEIISKINTVIPDINWIKPKRNIYGLKINENISLEKIGTDLWLMAIAAYNITKTSTIVVSCGTGFVTVFINDKGELCGVKIMSGLFKQLETLDKTTANIGYIKKGDYDQFPKNTQDAVISGIIDGYMGLIQTSLNDLHKQNDIYPKLLISGGYTNWLSIYLKEHFSPIFYENLVLEGLKYFLNQSYK